VSAPFDTMSIKAAFATPGQSGRLSGAREVRT
jgi:hypothetical protein